MAPDPQAKLLPGREGRVAEITEFEVDFRPLHFTLTMEAGSIWMSADMDDGVVDIRYDLSSTFFSPSSSRAVEQNGRLTSEKFFVAATNHFFSPYEWPYSFLSLSRWQTPVYFFRLARGRARREHENWLWA